MIWHVLSLRALPEAARSYVSMSFRASSSVYIRKGIKSEGKVKVNKTHCLCKRRELLEVMLLASINSATLATRLPKGGVVFKVPRIRV